MELYNSDDDFDHKMIQKPYRPMTSNLYTIQKFKYTS